MRKILLVLLIVLALIRCILIFKQYERTNFPCFFCGRQYKEHSDNPTGVKIPCGIEKKGYVADKRSHSNPAQVSQLRQMPLTTKLQMRRSISRELFEFMAHQTVLDCKKHYQWLVIFGTDDIENLQQVASIIVEDRFDNVMISGGVGRLTKSLYSKIQKIYGLENLKDKESEAVMICDMLSDILDGEIGYPQVKFWLETRSRNTKENSVNSIRMMDLSGSENILLVQTPLQQRRAWCTMRKTLDDMGLNSVVLDSYSGYIPEETEENMKILNEEITVRMPSYSKKGDMYAFKVPDVFRQNH